MDCSNSWRRAFVAGAAGFGGFFAICGTGIAADSATTSASDAGEEEAETVLITGSRLRRDEFSSTSPVQVITRDQSVLAGLASTTEILQGSTVSGGGQQINNYFGGFVTEGGPGANTLSLRGLGAVRTLILLNGRRIAPAGSRGQVGSADLNVLPSAMVERIEILKDGASSIYGSDAVAGVVNIITKRGIDEWTVEGNGLNTMDGGGNQTTGSLVGGYTGDRLEISGSVEHYERSSLAIGQRDWASCTTENLRDPATGQRLDQVDPLTGRPKCFPISGLSGTNGVAHNYVVSVVGSGARWEPDSAAGAPIPGWRNVDVAANRAPFSPLLLNESLISPAKTTTGFFNLSYDLNALGNAELYAEVLGTRRQSQQVGTRQLSLDYPRLIATYPTGNPLVPAPFALSGGGLGTGPLGAIAARALLIWGNDTTSSSGNFWRLLGGLKGALGDGGWNYDVNVATNRARFSYTFESFLTDRVYNSLDVVVAPATATYPTRTVNGVRYTCRANTTNAAANCVPAPQMNSALLRGVVDDAYRSYLFGPVVGNTAYDEHAISAYADGELFNLPAGAVKAVFGTEYRSARLNDTPSTDSITGNLYNLTSAGITKGKDSVKEAFTELELPVLRGKTGAQDLTLNLSGRYTDYQSYGGDETYKLGIGYTPVNWLRLRGSTGTSFRAPAIYEQYLSPTSGFLSAQNDPCNQYTNLPTTSVRYRNCVAENLPINPATGTFIASSSIRVDAAGGAAQGLGSEQSKATTLGLVIQPTTGAAFGDISLALDVWKIDVEDQVDRIGGSALLRLCYDDPQFRAGGSYCRFVDPRSTGAALRVQDNFLNIARQIAGGVDYNVRYSRMIGTGELLADIRATRYTRQDSKLFPNDPFDEANGTLFQPKWAGDTDIRYEWRDWTFRWGMTYTGAQDSYAFFEEDPNTSIFDLRANKYVTHSVSVKYENANKWSVIAGVRNLTDEVPDTISAGVTNLRVGDSMIYSGYDYFGRTAYLNVSKSFSVNRSSSSNRTAAL